MSLDLSKPKIKEIRVTKTTQKKDILIIPEKNQEKLFLVLLKINLKTIKLNRSNKNDLLIKKKKKGTSRILSKD